MAGEKGARPPPNSELACLRADGFPRLREIGSFISFFFLFPAVLRWGFTDLFEHLGIAGLRVLLATFDELDNEAPLVPVVEQEQHFVAYGWERLGDGRPFHALRISSHAQVAVVQ